MSKKSSLFACQQCGYQTPKWLGKCPECQQWNTLVEERIERDKTLASSFYTLNSKPLPLTQIESDSNPRIVTGIHELDRLLGGGLVAGSTTLLGGDPGIGKSTLVLQIQNQLTKQGKKTFYLTGEESLAQIRLRAERLGIQNQNITVLSENNLETALQTVAQYEPDFLVVDSIQTVYLPDLGSAPGSVSQVRECAGKLLYFTKSKGLVTWLVGHITKEGSLAGPKILEHLVDTVLYFEGDRGQPYRLLRTFKNRYGATHEVGVFEMGEKGLMEIENPSSFFLSHKEQSRPGSVVVSSLEGTRPILAELQALVVPSHLATPRRVTVGVDSSRVALLAAVLEKVCGFVLANQDIFINVVGGLSLEEPAIDLGVLLAMVSSLKNKSLPPSYLVLGEVGLTGEIRPVAGALFRILEGKKLGYKNILLPKKSAQDLKAAQGNQDLSGIEFYPVGTVHEALEFLK